MRERADVLIVEDEAVVRKAVRRILSAEDLVVVQVETAPEALAAIQETSFRLVLCDLMLPGVSGFDLIPQIIERAPEAPVIAITGYATATNLLEVFSLGAFDFLPKPFDVPELVGVVRRGLRYRDRQERRGEAAEVRGGERATDGPPEPRYAIGGHAWVGLDPDGSATFGVGNTFHHLVGDRTAIDLPAVGEEIAQARCFARMPAEGALYRVWAPLSGRVIAVNPRLLEAPEVLDRDPYGEGWLVRIVPQDLDRELGALDRRQAAIAT